MNVQTFKEMALSFPGTIENPHFDRVAFKVINKRIFATLHQPSATANLKLSKDEQALFCSYDKKAIYPVANKWGLQGWTTMDLGNITQELILEALDSAYKEALKTKSKK